MIIVTSGGLNCFLFLGNPEHSYTIYLNHGRDILLEGQGFGLPDVNWSLRIEGKH